MGASLCTQCGQPLPNKRLGVEMSALKARIVDMVIKGGDNGVPTDAVYDAVFDQRHCSRASLRAHVWQINELLADEGYRIVSIREHNQHKVADRYRMARIRVRT